VSFLLFRSRVEGCQIGHIAYSIHPVKRMHSSRCSSLFCNILVIIFRIVFEVLQVQNMALKLLVILAESSLVLSTSTLKHRHLN
jgi:hypothetical protein